MTVWEVGNVPTELEKTLTGTNIYEILKYIPVGIVFLECPKGKVTYANDRAIKLYGVNPLGLEIKDQATKLMTLLRSNGEPYPTEMLPMSRALNSIIVTNEELIIQRHVNGSRIIVSANAVPLKNEKGLIVGSVGVFEDITERKNLEKQLQEQERMATIGQTAGMVGHDIRNPLQSIMGDLYLAKSEIENIADLGAKETLMEYITSIQEQIDYISKIVSDLQDFSKPLKPCIEEVNLEKMLHDICLTSRIPKNIQLTCLTEKDAQKLRIDSAFLKRILTNLITNSVQAMPDGGKLIINASRKDGKVFISVEDTGKGIPDEVKGKIFKPLVSTKAKGQGFGLAVVKRLTDALGGKVSFETERGKGTKFILEFAY